MLMTTSSVEGGQVPFDIVQRRVTEVPAINPVTPEVGEEGAVTVAVPDMTLHIPVPTAGVFPANVVEVPLQMF